MDWESVVEGLEKVPGVDDLAEIARAKKSLADVYDVGSPFSPFNSPLLARPRQTSRQTLRFGQSLVQDGGHDHQNASSAQGHERQDVSSLIFRFTSNGIL